MSEEILKELVEIRKALNYNQKLLEEIVYRIDEAGNRTVQMRAKFADFPKMLLQNPVFKQNPEMAKMFDGLMGMMNPDSVKEENKT